MLCSLFYLDFILSIVVCKEYLLHVQTFLIVEESAFSNYTLYNFSISCPKFGKDII